jgi:hypothetical protein
MDRRAFVELYPLLWHMADPHNADGIVARGLLSTSALLDLYEYSGDARDVIERRHRPDNITIRHPVHGTAVVRDQKPLTIAGLQKSIEDGVSPEEFLHFLNRRVFFWLTEARLARMNRARAYRDYEKLVYVVDTGSLLDECADRILLSPMNSGATLPMPWPRSIGMFKSIEDYDFEARRKKADPIVELTVEGGIPNLGAHLVRTEIWKGGRLRVT